MGIETSESCQVILNLNSITRKISPLLMGGFIEHIGECIHDGIWAYSPVQVPLTDNADLDRIRKDLLFTLSCLRPSVLRWPGGCYADVYHWKDAVGPRSTRKTSKNKFWRKWGDQLMEGISENFRFKVDLELSQNFNRRVAHDVQNHFGTMEFLVLCEEIRSQPYITVNYGTGTPEEAADWVEYCNGSPVSNYGALRAMHGRTSPFSVPIWGIGNEIYLENEPGHEKDPVLYGQRYMDFARKMKEKDPSIKLIGCGWNHSGWNEAFLGEVEVGYINYLSIHQYLPFPTDLGQLLEQGHPDQESVYWAMMAAPFEIKKQILKAWNSVIKRFGERSEVKIAFDEWGIWYTVHDMVKTNYNLQDGLFAALVLMQFQKFTEICPLSLWSMLVNAFGMIQTDEEGLVLTPIYLVFKLFRDHTYSNLVENVSVTVDTFDVDPYGQIGGIRGNSLVDCSVTSSDDGSQVSVMLVNKHISEAITADLRIKAFDFFKVGKVVELTSQSPFDYNTVQNRTRVGIRESEINDIKPEMKLRLGPHSITILKMQRFDIASSI